MENDKTTPFHEHPQYLHGQVLALRALLIAVARLTTDRDSMKQEGVRQLETLRTALHATTVSDAQLAAIDEMQRWLEQVP